MSINFCTLANSTIDTFCGNRRQLVIDQLLAEKYPPIPVPSIIGTNNRNLRVDFAKRYPQYVQHVEQEDRPLLNFEQPFITVTAEFGGLTGSHQLETEGRLDFVMVTNLNLSPKQVETAVNITDFTVH